LRSIVAGFESSVDERVGDQLAKLLVLCKHYNGYWSSKGDDEERDESADKWKRSFLRAPYIRDELLRIGMILETFGMMRYDAK
jgi:alkyldihydroxyacetonephosphate synthase